MVPMVQPKSSGNAVFDELWDVRHLLNLVFAHVRTREDIKRFTSEFDPQPYTVRELDITPNKWSVSFQHILRAGWNVLWQMR